MTIEELRSEIASGAIDTVVIAMTDMQTQQIVNRGLISAAGALLLSFFMFLHIKK